MSYTTGLGYTPIFTITKGGEEVSGAFNDRCVKIEVESKAGGSEADTCDITIDDRGWSIESPSIGEDSATLVLSMGYKETQLYEMGSFQIDEISYLCMPKVILLHGNSTGFSTNVKAPIITSHDGKTLGDILGTVADAAGVALSVTGTLGSIAIPYLNQHASSLHMLQELERTYTGKANFQDGNLSFTERDSGLSASGQMMETFTLGPNDFGDIDIRCTNRTSYSKVRASYWDKVNHQLVWLNSTVTGSPNSDVPFMIKKAYPSQSEAQAGANSMMSSLKRQEKTGTVTLAEGHPGIRGGGKFNIAGCREGVDGTYNIDCARHTFVKDTGITTMLQIHSDPDEDDSSADEQTDGVVDANSLPATTGPIGGGIGAM